MERKPGSTASCALLLAMGLSPAVQGQAVASKADPKPVPAPLYSISFERKDAVAGLEASPALKLPFECTSDGSVFVTMVPLGWQLRPPLYTPPPLLLVSVSRSGKAITFPLDQATEQLFDVRETDHYASDSVVAFLIDAASENKPEKKAYTKPDGTEGEYTRNAAERRPYIITFDRNGEHKKTVETDVDLRLNHLGVFPSGDFLVFGYDKKDHSPKLAMLKEDGSLSRWLQIQKGDAPDSMMGTKDGSGKGDAVYVAPTELVPDGHSILVVQNKTTFPFLEVTEAGEIRAIHPRVPQEMRVYGLIGSDSNLYARVSPEDNGSIYELSAADGKVLRRFQLEKGNVASGVACVHDEKFLSFEHGDGKLIPLVGTAEPAADSTTVQPKPDN